MNIALPLIVAFYHWYPAHISLDKVAMQMGELWSLMFV
jgi:hypothetical protein